MIHISFYERLPENWKFRLLGTPTREITGPTGGVGEDDTLADLVVSLLAKVIPGITTQDLPRLAKLTSNKKKRLVTITFA